MTSAVTNFSQTAGGDSGIRRIGQGRSGQRRSLPEAAGHPDAEPGPAEPARQRAGDEPAGADQYRQRHREAEYDGAGTVRPVRADAGAAGRCIGWPRGGCCRQPAVDRQWRRTGRLRAVRCCRFGQRRGAGTERPGRRYAESGRTKRRPAQLRLAGRQRHRRQRPELSGQPRPPAASRVRRPR